MEKIIKIINTVLQWIGFVGLVFLIPLYFVLKIIIH